MWYWNLPFRCVTLIWLVCPYIAEQGGFVGCVHWGHYSCGIWFYISYLSYIMLNMMSRNVMRTPPECTTVESLGEWVGLPPPSVPLWRVSLEACWLSSPVGCSCPPLPLSLPPTRLGHRSHVSTGDTGLGMSFLHGGHTGIYHLCWG